VPANSKKQKKQSNPHLDCGQLERGTESRVAAHKELVENMEVSLSFRLRVFRTAYL
jgi:hypothetical protein